jgi:hypothetical protein
MSLSRLSFPAAMTASRPDVRIASRSAIDQTGPPRLTFTIFASFDFA